MDRSEELEIEDARRAVLEAVSTLPAEELELDSALGRVLSGDIVAERELPPFDSSAMDGFAVRAADLVGPSPDSPVALSVVAESRAGHPADVALEPGQAVAISTGAMLPVGADAIVRVEHTRRADGVVEVLERVPPGAEVRRAGEDVTAGTTVLRSGTPLEAAELGVLASLGHSHVSCARAPWASILITGDELLEPGQQWAPGAIADSNSHSIAALARRAGAEVASIRVGDDHDATREAIARAAEEADALVICGGVSVGAHDHVRTCLHELGARQVFWGLALRPGHPTWFGTLERVPVFGLPGNPVSAMVTFTLLVAPALRAMQGAHPGGDRASAILDGGYEKPAGRAHAARCSLRSEDDGLHARLTGPQGSHVLSSMLTADALAIIPTAATRVEPGARVEIVPLRGWVGVRE